MTHANDAETPRCGCPINAPEAAPGEFPCPCGDHCEHRECEELRTELARHDGRHGMRCAHCMHGA